MNAKVTTWWMSGNRVEQTMPESDVQRYLNNLPKADLKGYIVDAAPLEEIQPRAPIFKTGDPVIAGVSGRAVFIADDPKYPDFYVVRLDGFRMDYVLVKKNTVTPA